LFFKLDLLIFGIPFFVLFFVSAFLSIEINSIVINLIGMSILYFIFYELWHILMNFFFLHRLESGELWIAPVSQLLATALLLVPLGTAFWLTFKRMDVKPLKLQMRTYYVIVIPTLIVLITFIALMFKKYMIEA